MDWWKKTPVPAVCKTFSASYRYGFSDGAQGKTAANRNYFSNEYAWKAYCAGFAAGELKAEERREGEEERRGDTETRRGGE